jgi:nucleoside-triphosphatase THEP1
MLTVTVNGNRGEGKTTVALELAKRLAKLGFAVQFQGTFTGDIQRAIKAVHGIKKQKIKPEFSSRKHIIVIDGAT